jgi:CubicO group peptidase (beta-lactamase class C family)
MNLFPYEKEVEPELVDMDRKKLESVVAAFEKQQMKGAFPGGQLALRRNGKLVLNRSVGLARGFRSGESSEPIKTQPQTQFYPENSFCYW